MANSNAIATLTIQDQDLLTPGLANLVNRVNALVTFPSGSGVFYAGYATVQAGGSLVLVPATQVSPFVYVRNITANAGVLLDVNFTAGGVAQQLFLSSGGIWLVANSTVVTSGANSSAVTNVFCAPLGSGNIATVEYLWAN